MNDMISGIRQLLGILSLLLSSLTLLYVVFSGRKQQDAFDPNCRPAPNSSRQRSPTHRMSPRTDLRSGGVSKSLRNREVLSTVQKPIDIHSSRRIPLYSKDYGVELRFLQNPSQISSKTCILRETDVILPQSLESPSF